ncbi:ORF071L [Rock bream iridovirus]|uniref:ORF071L n=1 Tax=Rock bream iridovirus TaxID=263891 RepID=Q5YF16_ISKNV|nr:ORF071L [Rock bream iridovirus]
MTGARAPPLRSLYRYLRRLCAVVPSLILRVRIRRHTADPTCIASFYIYVKVGVYYVRVCCVYARPAAGRKIEFVFVCRLKSRRRQHSIR